MARKEIEGVQTKEMDLQVLGVAAVEEREPAMYKIKVVVQDKVRPGR